MVTDAKQANEVLKWIVFEMEGRIRMLASEGVRNIDQYNNILRGAIEAGEKKEDENGDPLQPLPYIIVVIDELADLMLVSSSDSGRLHHPPSANGSGGGNPLGSGDPTSFGGRYHRYHQGELSFAYLFPRTHTGRFPDHSGLERGRAAPRQRRHALLASRFGSTHPSPRPLRFRSRSGTPRFFLEKDGQGRVQSCNPSSTGRGLARFGRFEKDEFYDKAARLVVEAGFASVSHLQRRMRLGYSRAARIVDMLEADGIVGPPDGFEST